MIIAGSEAIAGAKIVQYWIPGIPRSEDLEADGALGDYRPLRALADAVNSFHPDQIVIATLPLETSVWHRFDVVDRARRPPRLAGHPCRGNPCGSGTGRQMTIIAGFSSSRQGSAPLNLAAQLARPTGAKVIAAAVVERARPAGAEDEYRRLPRVPGNCVA